MIAPLTDTLPRWQAAFARCPLVAILRGLPSADALAVGRTLVDAGFTLIEVPLNSPDPLASIAALRAALPREVLVGAGTVTTMACLDALLALDAELVVMPHTDAGLVRRAVQAGRIALPGVLSPTEAFTALAAGAAALKLFPAELASPAVCKALRAVLPPGTPMLPVGGVTPALLAPYRAAGAAGAGLGSQLYAPGIALDELARRAAAYRQAWADAG